MVKALSSSSSLRNRVHKAATADSGRVVKSRYNGCGPGCTNCSRCSNHVLCAPSFLVPLSFSRLALPYFKVTRADALARSNSCAIRTKMVAAVEDTISEGTFGFQFLSLSYEFHP